MTALARDENNQVAQLAYLGASQDVAIGAASTQSAAFANTTTMVRLVATVDCRIAIAKNPTATATSTLLAGGAAEVFPCAPGDKVAVIQQAGAGTLNVTELR